MKHEFEEFLFLTLQDYAERQLVYVIQLLFEVG